MWKYLITILSISSSLYYANFAAFRYDFNYSSYKEYEEACSKYKHIYLYTPEEIYRMDFETNVVEMVFAIQILLSFITEYYAADSHYPVRNLNKIAQRYLAGSFIIHLIPVIPWSKIFVFKYSKLL